MKEIFVAQFQFYIQGFPERSKNVNFSTWDEAELKMCDAPASIYRIVGYKLVILAFWSLRPESTYNLETT